MNTLFAVAGPAAGPTFYDFYAASLRTGLFTGFLTLSGFLLTALTLTVIQIKKELCEKSGYVRQVHARRAATRASNDERVAHGRRPKPEPSFYGGLQRLGGLIWATIICSLATSVCQFTVGVLYPSDTAAYICLGMAGMTAVLLLVDLLLVGQTIRAMFAHWEAEAAEAAPPPVVAGS